MTGLEGIVLTPENAQRVEDAIRMIERRARAIQPTYRRRQRFIPGGGGGTDVHLAYCKIAAGTGNTIVCFLDNPFPRVWVAATPYAIDKLVCCGGDEKVYVSLQNNNTGHTPATSPTWWKEVKNWVNTTTYAANERVFGSDGLIYKSLQAANVNHLITETAWWEKFGPGPAGQLIIQGQWFLAAIIITTHPSKIPIRDTTRPLLRRGGFCIRRSP